MVSLFAKTHVSHVAAGVGCLSDLLVVSDQLVFVQLIFDLLVVLLDSMILEQSRVVKMVASVLEVLIGPVVALVVVSASFGSVQLVE